MLKNYNVSDNWSDFSLRRRDVEGSVFKDPCPQVLQLRRIPESVSRSNYILRTQLGFPHKRFVYQIRLRLPHTYRRPDLVMASTAVLFGSTGLLGQHLLSTLLAVDTYQAVHTISRRPPKTESPKLSAQIETDTSKWATALSTISPTPSIVVSALGTTKFQAGTIADQWKIDHDREPPIHYPILICMR